MTGMTRILVKKPSIKYIYSMISLLYQKIIPVVINKTKENQIIYVMPSNLHIMNIHNIHPLVFNGFQLESNGIKLFNWASGFRLESIGII